MNPTFSPFLLAVFALAFLAGSPAHATSPSPDLALATYSFDAFEFDQPDGVNSPLLSDANLTLTVFGATSGDTVFIRISNDSDPLDMNVSLTNPTITGIYFDDDSCLLSHGFIYDTTGTREGEGVDMTFDAKPANLPGGNNIGFSTHISLSATPPPSKTGIDPFESITLGFAATDANHVVQALTSSDLRVALHVQEIGAGGELSASFVAVPEPGSAFLLAVTGMLALTRRQRLVG